MEPIEAKGDYVLVRVRVRPRAARNEVTRGPDGGLYVALTAAPKEGEANAALLAFLAKRLDVAKSRITLTAGAKARSKTVRIDGIAIEEICRVLSV
ncbi:MAG TPA: DUF167 domain-containing protein [Candidatus Hydrogenedentes bacterium]|nr:DUF167 domain-containing protein [Candidatus Hydrogenedentota bacterium]